MYGVLITMAMAGTGQSPAWGGGHAAYAPAAHDAAPPGRWYYPYGFPDAYAGGYGGIHGGCGGYFASGCHGSCHGYSFGGACYGYYISPYLTMPYGTPINTPSALALREGGPVDYPVGVAAPGGAVISGAVAAPVPGYIHGTPVPGPTMAPPAGTPGTLPMMTPPEKIAAPKEAALLPAPARGTVVVNLPADAKLFADGKPTRGETAERTFETPTLRPGRKYEYELRVEVVRGGRVRTETKTVTLSAGSVARVEFADPVVKIASK